MSGDADQELEAGRERLLLERGLDEIVDPQDPFSPRVAHALAVSYMEVEEAIPPGVQQVVVARAVVLAENIKSQFAEWRRHVDVTKQNQPEIFAAVKPVMKSAIARLMARSFTLRQSEEEIRLRSFNILEIAEMAEAELRQRK